MSWRAALETLNGKELKPLDAKEFAQTTVDDAKRWNGFLNKVYEKNDAKGIFFIGNGKGLTK